MEFKTIKKKERMKKENERLKDVDKLRTTNEGIKERKGTTTIIGK
jgi:hypothetical protein